VRIIQLGQERGTALTGEGTTGASWVEIARTEDAGSTELGVVYLGAGGRLSRREAVAPQLFLVVAGDGWVTDADGARHRVRPGEGAYLVAGEVHDVTTDTGLTALVLGAERMPLLLPDRNRPPRQRESHEDMTAVRAE
jgi:quercetin dioxygenase-like cupin family protein